MKGITALPQQTERKISNGFSMHDCIHRGGLPATQEQCREFTSIAPRNKQCADLGCTCKWRLCIACVKHGTVGHNSQIHDIETGLCETHIDEGEGFKIPPFQETKASQHTRLVSRKKKMRVEKDVSPSEKVRDKIQKILATGKEVVEISVSRITRDENQPRQHFDEQNLREFGQCIKNGALIQPIQVRRAFDDPLHDYIIIHGERRWRAHVLENIATIRCVILEVKKEDARFAPIISVIANVAAEVHAPLEIANSINNTIQEFSLTIKEVAKLYGKSSAWVLKYYNLLKLDQNILAMLHPEIPEDEHLSVISAVELSQYSEHADFVSEMADVLKGKKIPAEEVRLLLKNKARTTKTIPVRESARKSREEANSLVVFIETNIKTVNKFLDESERSLNGRFINVTEMARSCNKMASLAQKMKDLARRMYGAKSKR